MADYDVIIVGAGSAGCVLANRLSEDGSRKILVLEAGKPDDSWLIKIPIGVGKVWQAPEFNWSYTSAPEPNLGGRQIFHPRGKVVGGSSSINMMAYVRGNAGDYDRWAQKGCSGWSYTDVLPYFRRAESFEDPANPYHGDSGPLTIKTNAVNNPLIDYFLKAGESAGYGITSDYNGRLQEGFARLQVNVRDGKRCSAAVAYLHPALKRPNLELRTGALVHRIVFDGKKATGLEVERGGSVETITANEIILSGGAVNSPQLLMLSGVGPAEHLKDHGIDVVHDHQAVGDNLQDHPSVSVDYRYKEKSEYHQHLRFDRIAMAMIRGHLFGTGFASIPPSSATAFIRSRSELAIPDIQMFFRPASNNAHEWFPVFKPPADETYTMRSCQLRPESRGTIRLSSGDVHDKAVMQNNFLSTDEDKRVLREAIRISRTLSEQPVFDGVRGPEFVPGADVTSDDEIDAYVRETLSTVYHPSCTVRMGPDEASGVDMEMRVRGIEGVRVVDASVMPDIVGGNINAPVLMIAEKASDIILGKAPPAPLDLEAAAVA